MIKRGLLIVNSFLKNARFDSLYQMFCEAFAMESMELKVVGNAECLARICQEKKDEDIDFILFYDKDVLLARHLENLGYKVFNSSRAIEICDDKGLTAVSLEKDHILMPKTILSPFTFSNITYDSVAFLDYVISELGLPLIMKENKGSFGNEVYLISTKDELIKKTIQLSGKGHHFQKYIASSFGCDVRVLVVGELAIGSVKRISNSADFRSNVLQGGSMEKFSLHSRYEAEAVRIAKILGLDFCSVDFLIGENQELIFCEANSNVHFKTFYTTTGINFANYVAKLIENKIN